MRRRGSDNVWATLRALVGFLPALYIGAAGIGKPRRFLKEVLVEIHV